MARVETITIAGNRTVSTLNGRLVIDEGSGRFVVTDATGIERSVQDVNGTHIYDPAGNERSRLDTLGLTTIRTDGTYANRVGQATDDGRDGVWSAKSGVDLSDEGI